MPKYDEDRFARLTLEAIEGSPEVSKWLDQFPPNRSLTAKNLLMRLRFVSRDDYSIWLGTAMASLAGCAPVGLFSVRKIDSDEKSFWTEDGLVIKRPGHSLGSEDLVYSLISNHSRRDAALFDHPSVAEIRDNRIRNIALIDDSIGSGNRVVEFIRAILKNKTLMSWWSFGWIRIYIFSLARTFEGEEFIASSTPGSDHPVRKFRKSQKLIFSSALVYHQKYLDSRWGPAHAKISELVNEVESIPALISRGVGAVMANLIFHHSVPDNTPGVLWSNARGWQPLFENRALPTWILPLLTTGREDSKSTVWSHSAPSGDMLRLLKLIRTGVRSVNGIALRLSCEAKVAQALLVRARSSGLVSTTTRLTVVGRDLLKREVLSIEPPKYNWTLYTPTRWCTPRASTQPLAPEIK